MWKFVEFLQPATRIAGERETETSFQKAKVALGKSHEKPRFDGAEANKSQPADGLEAKESQFKPTKAKGFAALAFRACRPNPMRRRAVLRVRTAPLAYRR